MNGENTRLSSLISEARSGALTRRQVVHRGIALGLSVGAIGAALGNMAPQAGAQDATPEGGATTTVGIVNKEMTHDEIVAAIQAEGQVNVGNWTYTANDTVIAKFVEYVKTTYGVDIKSKKPIRQSNRNPLLYKDTGADGLKTGHTNAAGYGLTASAKRGDRRLVLVVNGLASMNQRSQESERLLDFGFREWDNYKLFSAGSTVETAQVWLGEAPTVPLVIDRNVILTLARKDRPGLQATISYDGPIKAPIAKGTPVGRLVVTAPNTPTQEIPLLAGTDVQKLGFSGRIAAAFNHMIWGKSAQ